MQILNLILILKKTTLNNVIFNITNLLKSYEMEIMRLRYLSKINISNTEEVW